MEIKKINLKNIGSFIEGNLKYVYDKLIGLDDHIKEQVEYRLFKCKDDCVVSGKCIICTCPTEKKALVKESCNPDRFPDLMTKAEWELYKKGIDDYEQDI
tara:strand:- start:88518 stop:88817 length:300 start_codon:yes stop_codon:yes gene_type:complete